MPFFVTAVIIVVTTILLAALTFGSGAALVVATVIPIAAILGGIISSATGGDFLDGFMLGAAIGAVPAAFTSFITNILRLFKGKKKRD
jgi:hypothetical protein